MNWHKLLMFFILFVANTAMSQNYYFDHFGTKDGLPSNQVQCIYQAENGLIWISTQNGICTFDGKNFKRFKDDKDLNLNRVYSLFEDSKNRIWIGSYKDGPYYIKNNKLNIDVKFPNEFKKLGIILHFLEDINGNIYVFCSRGIAKFDGENYSIINDEPLDDYILNPKSVAWIDSNTVIVATIGNGFLKITLNPYSKEAFNSEIKNVNNQCYSVFVDGDSAVWVGSYGVLYKYYKDSIVEFVPSWTDFGGHVIHAIEEVNDSILTLGFSNDGFSNFNKNTGLFEIINQDNGLPSNHIATIAKDHEGNFLFSTNNRGIIRYRNKAFRFYNETNGLPSNSITGIELWNNEILISSYKGLYKITNQNKIEPIIENALVRTMTKTADNELLLGIDEEVIKLNENGTKELIENTEYVARIYKDSKITIYEGGKEIAGAYINGKRHQLGRNSSYAIRPIGDRHILAKSDGIFQLHNGKESRIKNFEDGDKNTFFTLENISKNEIITAGNNDLYHIKLTDSVYTVKSIKFDYLDKTGQIFAVRTHKEYIWIASAKYLVKVKLSSLLNSEPVIYKSYDITNYLGDSEVDEDGMLISTTGEVILRSQNGVLIFDENELTQNTAPPTIYLEQILLYENEINDSLYRQEKNQRTSEKLSLKFEPDENYLTFVMHANSFTNASNVKFKFRLKGLRDADEWSPVTQDNKAIFPFLVSGDYVFEFTADNGNDVWQEEIFSLPFIIKTPFWERWYFILGMTLLLLFFSVWILNWFNAIRKKQAQEFTQNLLHAQEEERHRISREIHDGIGQQLILLSKKAKMIENGELAELTSQALDEVRALSLGLHPALLERLGLSAAIRSMIDTLDENNRVLFTYDIEDIDAFFDANESLHIYRIIQELLNNIIKHANAKAVSILIKKEIKEVRVIIQDSGSGFDYQTEYKSGSGLGMRTLNERARILNAKFDVKSSTKKGTSSLLIIPIKNEKQR